MNWILLAGIAVLMSLLSARIGEWRLARWIRVIGAGCLVIGLASLLLETL